MTERCVSRNCCITCWWRSITSATRSPESGGPEIAGAAPLARRGGELARGRRRAVGLEIGLWRAGASGAPRRSCLY